MTGEYKVALAQAVSPILTY